MSRMEFKLTQPCALCPFRSDIRAFLSRSRAQGIALSLQEGTFACHETTSATKEQPRAKDGTFAPRVEQHCAGALILMMKSDHLGCLQQVASRLGWLDLDRLKLDAPVFDTFQAFIDAQPEPGTPIKLPRRIWYEH